MATKTRKGPEHPEEAKEVVLGEGIPDPVKEEEVVVPATPPEPIDIIPEETDLAPNTIMVMMGPDGKPVTAGGSAPEEELLEDEDFEDDDFDEDDEDILFSSDSAAEYGDDDENRANILWFASNIFQQMVAFGTYGGTEQDLAEKAISFADAWFVAEAEYKERHGLS